MAQSKNKLPLSKEAQALLDEILSEEKLGDIFDDTKPKSSMPKEDVTASADFVMTKVTRLVSIPTSI